MASAAAVALFLLVSTPVRDVNQEAYTASFVPTGMVVQKPVLLEAVLPDSTVAEADTKQESSEEVIAREVEKSCVCSGSGKEGVCVQACSCPI